MSDSDGGLAPIDRLALRYSKSTTLRTFVQLLNPVGISVGSALDAALTTRIANIRNERLRCFFDELERGRIDLTQEVIESEDFLHSYFSTVRAVLNTKHREKLHLFARLLAHYYSGTPQEHLDQHEEYLSLLEDISFREFQVLTILHRFEAEAVADAHARGEEMNGAGPLWDEFVRAVVSQTGIPQEEIAGVLARLNRTGLYKTFSGARFGLRADTGQLTPNFRAFIKVLGLEPQ